MHGISLTLAASLNGFLLFLLALAGVAAAVSCYARIWGLRAGKSAHVIVGLRLAAVAFLLLFLLRPVLGYDVRNRHDARVLFLLDASRSMAHPDSLAGARRFDTALALLTDRRAGLLRALEPVADLRIWTCGAGATPCPPERLTADPPTPTAEATDLRGALDAAVAAEGAEHLEAVILFSDGQENGGTGSAEESARTLGVPVHCVGLGGPAERGRDFRDLAVTRVDADRLVFVDNRLAVKAHVLLRGAEELERTVSLRHAGATLDSVTASLHAGGNDVLLGFTPTVPGTYEYEVHVEPLAGERLTENNSRYVIVTVSEDKVKLLFYEATLRWEYKYATRVLARDPTILFTGLVKTNTDRVYHQGDTVGGASAGDGGLPVTRDGFKRLDCVVLGDVGRQDFLPGQLAALEQYVAEDGGGLLVVGGRRVLGDDGLRGTPIEDALPLTLAEGGRELRGRFAPELTVDGRGHPALAGLERFFTGAGLTLDSAFTTGTLKPGATALLTAPGPGGTALPLLATQRFGKGRVALYATEADWKWATQARDRGGEEALALLWGQLARWLAGRQDATRKDAGRLLLTTDKEIYRAGETVRVAARGAAADAALRAGLVPTAALAGPDGKATALTFTPAPAGFDAAFRPESGGEYTVTASLPDASATRRIVVERNTRELDQLGLNEELLRRIAGYSGGQYFTALNAREIPELIAKNARLGRTHVELSVDRSPGFFLLFLVTLTAEWVLRRRLQLV